MDNTNKQFLSGGGEMGTLIRTRNWGNTSLGPVEGWPQSLLTTLNLVINSKFPMFLCWGPELVCFYNDAYRPSLGQNGKHHSILGKGAAEAWAEIWDIIKPLIDQVLAGEEATWLEDELIPIYRNGRIEDVYWTFSYSPVYDESGKVAGVLATCRETTEKVRTVRLLEESNRRFFNYIMQAPVAMCVLRGKNFVVESANGLMLKLLGKTADHIINRPVFEGLFEAKEQGLRQLLENTYHTGEKIIADEPIDLPRNGEIKTTFINFRAEALKEPDETISGIVVVAYDVTMQVMARKDVEESEQKFRLLADLMPQLIWTSEPQGTFSYFNRAVYDYSGLTCDELMEVGWLQIVHPFDREESMTKWLASVSTGKDLLVEHRFRRRDGEYRWQRSCAIPQKDAAGNIQMWVGTSTDIHDQKTFVNMLEREVQERTKKLNELNQALAKSEKRYHLMVEEVQDYAILYLNRQGVVENWNKGAEKIKGYRADEIIGQNFSVFYAEHDRQNHLPEKLLAQASSTGKAVQEGWRVRQDKSLFWASVVITAVHDEENNVIGFSKVTRDLTEKKAADDKLKLSAGQLVEKNIELEKMNSELQSFAYVSSHDLQEPLRKIQTFASRILDKESQNLSESGKEYLIRMKGAANSMQTLIRDLLTYSRTNSHERDFQITDLNEIVNELKNDFRETLVEKNGVIHADKMCKVRIIPFQFRQLFFNLISNALKFSKPGGRTLIKIKSETAYGNRLENESLSPHMKYCHISVSDNGIGFDPQYKERIFEMFQRLHGKHEYSGTGIGLSIVKKIVENHNGIITASAELNKGATFDIYIPAS